MLDEYLNRVDVQQFIKEIKTNERYFLKEKNNYDNYDFYISRELALYIFYEALYKYRIILDDMYLFEEYMEQLERLYRKLDNYADIVLGINKLICKMTIIKLNINNIEDEKSREEIITYIYDKYVKNGYYFHGINSSYVDTIKENGFIPEEYENYYDRFEKVNDILKKYNVDSIITKDFQSKKVNFTGDFTMACYYSVYGPLFFYKFLSNDTFGKLRQQDSYLKDSLDPMMSHLKRFMSNNMFKEEDRDYIIKLIEDEWSLLHRRDKHIALIFLKRSNLYCSEEIKLEDCLNDQDDIYDVIDRILSPKQSNVVCKEPIKDVNILELDNYYEKEKIVKKEKVELSKEEIEFMNDYGKISIFLILGSLLITLGVIISIFMIVRGH